MNALKKLGVLIISFICIVQSIRAEEFHIKYKSNYIMPTYIHFKKSDEYYSIISKINIPLYNIVFNTGGKIQGKQFNMLNYQDIRNGKTYAKAEVKGTIIQYGKVVEPLKQEILTLPTFDLFSIAFQLSYYGVLPYNFQTTNGKKLYPHKDTIVNESRAILRIGEIDVEEITYRFKTGAKQIIVKKFSGEKISSLYFL